jgi:hypothetical protein
LMPFISPVTNIFLQIFDSFVDNTSSYVQQLSNASFWDSLDDLDSSEVAKTKMTEGFPTRSGGDSTIDTTTTIAAIAQNTSENSSKSSTSGLKRKRITNVNTSKLGQKPVDLDCSDYVLGFHSNNKRIDNGGAHNVYASPATPR